MTSRKTARKRRNTTPVRRLTDLVLDLFEHGVRAVGLIVRIVELPVDFAEVMVAALHQRVQPPRASRATRASTATQTTRSTSRTEPEATRSPDDLFVAALKQLKFRKPEIEVAWQAVLDEGLADGRMDAKVSTALRALGRRRARDEGMA